MTRVSLSFASNGQSIKLPEQATIRRQCKNRKRACGRQRTHHQPPAAQVWDSFFTAGSGVSEDFMAERETAVQPEREQL